VAEPAGAHCVAGGLKVQVGAGAVTYVCNGVQGANGTNGQDVVVTAEPNGVNCASGGTKFQVGAGTPAYVCNGTNGTNGTSCSVVTGFSTVLACTDGTSYVLNQKYSVGGTVTGFVGNFSLQDNGGDTLAVSANGAYTFANGLSSSASYAVTVSAPPANVTCSVSNGHGVVAGANVSNANVACGCNADYANCDGDGSNGCETSTAADNNNCGGCGNVCAAGNHCAAGACAPDQVTSAFVNGLWWYRGTLPQQSCNTVCNAYGRSPADDTSVFNAQNDSTKCTALRDVFNPGAYVSVQSYGYACAESEEEAFMCSNSADCPLAHRNYADAYPISICACQTAN
jgi:hypothetical protein